MSQHILYLDYNKTTQDLISAGISKSTIFYPFDSPDKKEYLNFYWTWQTSLSYYDRLLGVRPCRFFFIDDARFAAVGGRKNECFVIGISSGMVHQLKVFFIEGNDDIYEKFTDKQFSLLKRSGWDSLQSLMRDTSLRFAMDHEFAHVLQRSDNKLSWTIEEFNELTNCDEIYSEEKHVMEFDADIRGAYGVASVVLSYWESADESIRTDEYFRVLVTSALASIACLFSLLPTADFYVEKYKHPHPVIRIQYVMDFLHNFFLDNEFYRNMDHDKILNDAWAIANLFLNKKPKMVVTKLYEVFMNNKQAIFGHIDTLRSKSKNYPFLAMYKHAAWALPEINIMKFFEMDMQKYVITKFDDGTF